MVRTSKIFQGESNVTEQQIRDRWPEIQVAFAAQGVQITLTQALKLLPALEAVSAGADRPPAPPATIDLTRARIVNAPDARSWPQTASITRVWFDGVMTRVAFTKQEGPGRWPDVRPPGWDGPLQVHAVAVPAD